MKPHLKQTIADLTARIQLLQDSIHTITTLEDPADPPVLVAEHGAASLAAPECSVAAHTLRRSTSKLKRRPVKFIPDPMAPGVKAATVHNLRACYSLTGPVTTKALAHAAGISPSAAASNLDRWTRYG
jgi:hypothetical protein